MRKLKQEPCSNCGKVGVTCKCLCVACYSKQRRSTPEGKLEVRAWNEGKGVEARKRYLAKKPPKPPKQVKICECGNPVIAKGYCHNCYSKYYQREKNGHKERVEIKIPYETILRYVKKGYTISDACKILSIDRSTLYRKITELQKTELKSYKAIGTLHIY